MTIEPILETRNLCKYFPIQSGGKRALLKAVDQANLKIYPGKTLGLVGESGSPIDPPPGCRLASRCPVADKQCFNVNPELKEISPGHAVACIKAGIHRKAEPLTLSKITTTGDRLP